MYVEKFTTFTLQIPNLADEQILFHFIEKVKKLAKKEFEHFQVEIIDEVIA